MPVTSQRIQEKSRKRTAVGLEVMEVRSQSGADESRQLKQM